MPISGGGPDPKVAERLAQLVELEAAGLKWYWRTLAFLATLGTILSAVFQILNYYSN